MILTARILLLILLCTALALVLPGCSNKRYKALQYFENNPYELAQICGEKFPVKVEYKAGKETVKYDTVLTPADSIPCPPNAAGKVVYVKGKPGQIIYRDRLRIDTVYQENRAALDAEKAKSMQWYLQLKQSEINEDQLSKEVKKYEIYTTVMSAIAIVFTVLYFKKTFF